MTAEPIALGPVAAKLARPTGAGAVLRDETLDAFERALRRRLTVVTAPAGYGKTTCAAAAMETLGVDGIWYKLDLLDQDPVVFLASLTEALHRRLPAFGEAIRERLRSAASEPFPVAHLQVMFVRECEELLTGDVHIVLDDYHEASGSAATNRALDYLLTNLPPVVRLVVISRYDPVLNISKIRLDDEMAVLDADVLRFDVDQATQVLAARTGGVLPRRHAERLVEVTEGWPASIVLAGLARDWLDLDSIESALSSPRLRQDVYSYLAEQVYRRENRAVRRFLRRTCCLETITVELGDRLARTASARTILRHLAANRVFTFADGAGGPYRYHNLFREFLRQKVVQDDGEAAFRQLHADTAAALEEAGQIEMAVELYLAANEPGDALAAVARAGEALLDSLPSDRLASWLDRLPPALRAGGPWPCLLEAQLDCRGGDYDAALQRIGEALRLLEDAGTERELYEALSMRECALFWRGDTAQALDVCREALRHAETDRQRVHTLLSLGSAALDMRRWDDADEAFAAAEALLPQAPAAEQTRARALRAHAAYYRGDLRAARTALPQSDAEAVPAAVLSTLLNTQGLVSLGLADYEGALRLFERGRALCERCGYTLSEDMIRDNIGLLLGALGRVDEGLATVRRVMDGTAFAAEPTHAACALSHEATILRRAGRLEEALPPCRAAAARVPPERDAYVALNARANLEFLRSLLGDDRSAALLACADEAEAGGLAFVAMKALLYAAVVALGRGQARRGAALLERCLPRQLALGHLHLLAQELSPRPVCATTALRVAAARGLAGQLMEVLAVHRAFAGVVAAVADEQPDLVPVAVEAARTHATDEVLAGVLRAVGGPRSREAAAAIAAAVAQRPVAARPRETRLSCLTARELQVLGLMSEGRRNPEIAASLFLSLPTVKTHVNHIFTKLGVTTRVQAILAYSAAQGEVRQPSVISTRADAHNTPWV